MRVWRPLKEGLFIGQGTRLSMIKSIQIKQIVKKKKFERGVGRPLANAFWKTKRN